MQSEAGLAPDAGTGAGSPVAEDRAAGWRDVCAIDEIVPGTGAPALIDGVQVAIVRMPDAVTVYAVGNFDPFSKAYVMARGIVGDRAGVPKLASPIYKQTFDLRTGVCLEDPTAALPSWPVRIREGRIELQWPRKETDV